MLQLSPHAATKTWCNQINIFLKNRCGESSLCRPAGRPTLLRAEGANTHPPNHTPERKGAEGVAEGQGAKGGAAKVELLGEPVK